LSTGSRRFRDAPAWASFIVALLALIVTLLVGWFTLKNSSDTLALERQPVLTAACHSPTKKHPDYVLSIMSTDRFFGALAPFPEYNLSPGESAEECVYSNIGRLPLTEVVVRFDVQFLKTPVSSPVVDLTSNTYVGEITGIGAGGSSTVWITNKDFCYDANASYGGTADFTVPSYQPFKSYPFPGWVSENFRLPVDPAMAKAVGQQSIEPPCTK